MKKKNTILLHKAINNPKKVLRLLIMKMSPLLPDKLYLKLLFPLNLGYKLNLKNPQTYNEKLQWLKLYYHDPELPKLVDKYEYKKYVKKTIGEEYVVKNYGVWKNFDDINFNTLPSKFVLKTTHDQGGVVVCKNKEEFNQAEAKVKIDKHLKHNLYKKLREWPYKHVKPRIIAEELLEDKSKNDLWDYKFYCFNGKPKYMYISMGRNKDHTPLYYFDNDFNYLNISRPNHEPDERIIEKPKNWDLMINLAEKLSVNQPHVRVDFYNIDGKIFAGEFTLFQGGGMMPFIPEKWDYEFGKEIELPKQKLVK